MRKEYSKQERLERACLRAARNIRSLWEEKGSSDTRLLNPPLIDDELVLAGRSRTITGAPYREHVVPRLVIVNECHRMLERGESDEAIADFIQDHIKIVHISLEEAARLDQVKQLGLRQVMPLNWQFGGDIFARLAAAGIEWDAVEFVAD